MGIRCKLKGEIWIAALVACTACSSPGPLPDNKGTGDAAVNSPPLKDAGDIDGAVPRLPLSILLTNDDGWNTVGIQALKKAMTRAGHRVVLVGPAENHSGTGRLLTYGKGRLIPKGEDEYALEGTPATCVFVGLSLFDAKPDLIVAGTNHGLNLGGAVMASGTVGATIAALYNGIPAIALSAKGENDDNPEVRAQFDEIGAFLVTLLSKLQQKPGALANTDGLLPAGVALNINYPGWSETGMDGKSPRIATQSPNRVLHRNGIPEPVEQATFKDDWVDIPESDVGYFVQGHIPMVPLLPNGTAHARIESLSNLLNSEQLLPLSDGSTDSPMSIILFSTSHFDHPGLAAMQRVLTQRGHDVDLYGAREDFITTSEATGHGVNCEIQTQGERVYSMSTPFYCMRKALNDFDAETNLLVTVDLDHAFSGSLLPFSFPIGLATGFAQGGVNAITVNAPPFKGNEVAVAEGNETVAQQLSALIDRLQHRPERADGDPLLPGDLEQPMIISRLISLSLSFPPMENNGWRGIRVTAQGTGAAQTLAHGGPDRLVVFKDGGVVDSQDNSDTALQSQGYITIVPMTVDWTAPREILETLEVLEEDWPKIN